MGLAPISGLTSALSLAYGKIIKCTVEVFSSGLMGESTMENMLMTKSRASVSLPGLMGRNTRERGWTESKVDLEFSAEPIINKRKENGEKESASDGLREEMRRRILLMRK
jgi:hypothetical protein